MYYLCIGLLSLYGLLVYCSFGFFFFNQKPAYDMRISDWSSDVCSSDLKRPVSGGGGVYAKVAEILFRAKTQRHEEDSLGRKARFVSTVRPAAAWQGKSRFPASATSSCLCVFARNRSSTPFA